MAERRSLLEAAPQRQYSGLSTQALSRRMPRGDRESGRCSVQPLSPVALPGGDLLSALRRDQVGHLPVFSLSLSLLFLYVPTCFFFFFFCCGF